MRTTTTDITPECGSVRSVSTTRATWSGHWFDAIDADEVSARDVFRGSGFTPDGDMNGGAPITSASLSDTRCHRTRRQSGAAPSRPLTST